MTASAPPPATAPPASIVIPTRNRPAYLEGTLSSILPEAGALGCEVLVVDDSGPTRSACAVAARAGARYVAHPHPLGANAARNTGIHYTTGELVVLIDDDIQACEGLLEALLAAAERNPDLDVFAGRIDALLEGRPPRFCGREAPPITTLQLGPVDVETRFAWSANMAVRRSALLRVGPFDPTLHGQGEEQEWQERLHAHGGRVLYVAGARLMHRRLPEDSTLTALTRTAFARGAEARRFDARRGLTPSRAAEILTVLGCAGHIVRHRCPGGITMLAHATGRLLQALQAPTAPEHRAASEQADDFLSGESGTVAGLDRLRRELSDRATATRELIGGRRLRLTRAARSCPQQQVLALGVTREHHRARVGAITAELQRSRHRVDLHTHDAGTMGKFENLNALLEHHPPAGNDWLIVFDDDIDLPHGFLDRFLFLCERFRLDLAQPAHVGASHAAWQVTRRRPGSVLRETRFVEIGPLTAFSKRTFETLLPFPPLQMGWGLEAHWAAIAKQRGWRCGVVDAVAIRHSAAPAAHAYSRQLAIAEAREFLAGKPYLTAEESQRTLKAHHSW